MKYVRLFLILIFLVPNLLLAESKAKFHGKRDKDYQNAIEEQNQIDFRIKQFNNLHPHEMDQAKGIFDDAILCCTRGIAHLDNMIEATGRQRRCEDCSRNRRRAKELKTTFLETYKNLCIPRWNIELEGFIKLKTEESEREALLAKKKLENIESLKEEEKILALQGASVHIDNVIAHYEHFLATLLIIGDESYRLGLRQLQESVKNNLSAYKSLKQNIALELACAIFNEGKKKSEEAYKKEISSRPIYETDSVINNLKEAAGFYKEACSSSEKALKTLEPLPLEKEKQTLRNEITQLQKNEKRCADAVQNWPKVVEEEKKILKEKLALLKEEMQVTESRDLIRHSFTIQKQMIPIMDVLVKCNELDQNELDLLQKNMDFFDVLQDLGRLTDSTESDLPEFSVGPHFFDQDNSSVVKSQPWPLALLEKKKRVIEKKKEGLKIRPKDTSSAILSDFVKQMKKNPVALTEYVYNEIQLVDPFLQRENGVFIPPSIHRSTNTVFLDKQGSPWEQCMLLVELLQIAGYQAEYAEGSICSLPKDFVEKMLDATLSEEEVFLKYPWVRFFDGEKWISLFPWMKEIEVSKGHDVYKLLPEAYASANRFILRYLTNDENILRHIGPDGDDTAGTLFVRLVGEELRKKGLSLDDVGTRRTLCKKQYVSWEDFPRPSIQGNFRTMESLDKENALFAKINLEIFSAKHPEKKLTTKHTLVSLDDPFSIWFSDKEGADYKLHLKIGSEAEQLLALDPNDHTVLIKVSYDSPTGIKLAQEEQTLSIGRGTKASLCFHFGGTSSKKTSLFFDRFLQQTDEEKNIQAFLSFLGNAYFEKCSKSEQILASLHKTLPKSVFAFGLAKLASDLSKESGTPKEHPQVDMLWFTSKDDRSPSDDLAQFIALDCVDKSSKEHQILREIFFDHYAVSAIKLLQLAHLEHQKKGREGTGFVILNKKKFLDLENHSENAKQLHFSHLTEQAFDQIKKHGKDQWTVLGNVFNGDLLNPEDENVYAFITPGLISSLDGNTLYANGLQTPSYTGIGSLLIHPVKGDSLISDHANVLHGGIGSGFSNNNGGNLAAQRYNTASQNYSPSSQWSFSGSSAGFHIPPLSSSINTTSSVKIPITPLNPSTFSAATSRVELTRQVTSFPGGNLGASSFFNTQKIVHSRSTPQLLAKDRFSPSILRNPIPVEIKGSDKFFPDVKNPRVGANIATDRTSSRNILLAPKQHSYANQKASLAPTALDTKAADKVLKNSELSNAKYKTVPFIKMDGFKSDVRQDFKPLSYFVNDPVDVVTGAFYIDEVDLTLPGSFPLEIRRNYNNQNPIQGKLGVGWKLSLNPYLVEESDKIHAAEMDGTIIVYTKNINNLKWEVLPEHNPDLCNFTKKGIGSIANPFHAYIETSGENKILYGCDGSKRVFENNLLKTWTNASGSVLNFSYEKNQLTDIESSSGFFLGFDYNHKGKILKIHASGGRTVSYEYDPLDNLTKVCLPNDAIISYEYDKFHQIIRETKPHGKVLENIYDEVGRVIEQRSPVGPKEQIQPSAYFTYYEDEKNSSDDEDEYSITLVKDSSGATTTYKIFNSQIYKIIDPLGYETLQSWFINEFAWFDAETETKLLWKLDHLSADSVSTGAWPRSLKSSKDKRGLVTSYLYDDQGNPTQITLSGADLTGKGDTLIMKKFTYNKLNLCTQEEVLNRKTLTSYDSKFSYLPKRIERFVEDKSVSFVNWDYNELGQVKKENNNGAITLWEYDDRGFPSKIIQKSSMDDTRIDDSDVVTEYVYNHQGQCIQKTTADSTQQNDYDLMGNQLNSLVFSHTGKILSATRVKYNLNNQIEWQQGTHPEDIKVFSYNASGRIGTCEQVILPSQEIAKTYYKYDTRENLIQEVDALGYITHLEYDALGRVISSKKEGLINTFSYEAGGLLESSTTPSKAKTTRSYTTNGLLKWETYPDETTRSVVYDFFGRLLQETNNGITWEIIYDDANNLVTRIHKESGTKEIREFDARGNLIRLTDTSGAVFEKTYDGLNRLTSETLPTGEKTTWSYHENEVTRCFANGEKKIEFYEGGEVVDSKVFDSDGNLLEHIYVANHPELHIQERTHGNITTSTWMNSLGKPICIEEGNITTKYEYDLLGNCISSTDGEGRVTKQSFDPHGRMIKKEISDGSILSYVYDEDSNLIEYNLPGNKAWKAKYDNMGRKIFEELQADGRSSEKWSYTYKNGRLIKSEDPMGKIHDYLYDSQGRLIEESIDRYMRKFTYDPRGMIASAEELGEGEEKSIIKRSYDQSGRLIQEVISLNEQTIQETNQTWNPSGRSLQIGDHIRTLFYQNGKLHGVWAGDVQLSYEYYTSGRVSKLVNPFGGKEIRYNNSSLPETIQMNIGGNIYHESLVWDKSGKLSAYQNNNERKFFNYTLRGDIQSILVEDFSTNHQYPKQVSQEMYEFDFGGHGPGIRTSAPKHQVHEVDPFGKIRTEEINGLRMRTHYDEMGNVTSYNCKELKYDPWGRLIEFYADTYTWKASYDALGRRLQTTYTPIRGDAIVTTSLYDPEEEFTEIGVHSNQKTFWKIYGPNSCDAIVDETGETIYLTHNAQGHLTWMTSPRGIFKNEEVISAYGPQGYPYPIKADLLSYAKSLSWLSRNVDPTGLIWMGARYYDPTIGRFISQDPIGRPICSDLYSYANGDPINYYDPDGRFESPMYQTTEPTVVGDPIYEKMSHKAFRQISDLFPIRSGSYQVGTKEYPNLGIGYINGVGTEFKTGLQSAMRFSEYAGGAKINFIHNATHSLPIDVLECHLGYKRAPSIPVNLLIRQWKDFIFTHGPDAKFLQICHSGGAIHVKNALLGLDDASRKRIIVLALAPATIIPKELCHNSYNYVSKRDFVPYLDFKNAMRYGNQLERLTPHKNASFFDHSIESPTFERRIRRDITSTLNEFGGNR
ncbi:MAG: hypothetical protein HKM07_02490 [Chlamydiae bacterium]|nr:hypothetical protein [Chlamydiota bacterium]